MFMKLQIMSFRGIISMTKEQVKKIIAVLSENWNVKFNALKIELYGENLADLDYPKCCLAVKKLIQTSEFLPTVAALRKTYIGLDKEQIDSATAYYVLKKTISNYGIHNYKAAMEALKEYNTNLYELVWRLGWREVCMCPESFLANQFQKSWVEFEQEKLNQEVLSQNLLTKINGFKAQIQRESFKLLEDGGEDD